MILRLISGFAIGWFFADGLWLMVGHNIPIGYPTWVPIIGLAIIAAVNMFWSKSE